MFQPNHEVAYNIENQIKNFFMRFLESSKSVQKDTKEILGYGHKQMLVIDYNQFFEASPEISTLIFQNFYKYGPALNEVYTKFVREFEKQSPEKSGARHDDNKDTKDQEYQVTFNHGGDGPNCPDLSLRNINSQKLGKLISLRGTVTRTTEVRPEVKQGVFICTACKAKSRKIKQQFRYTKPRKCEYDKCNNSNFQILLGESTLCDFQKLRVQEEPGEIPPGGMPRSIDVIVRDENVEKAQPGDLCKFVGYICVVPEMQSMIKPGQKAKLSFLNAQTRGRGLDNEGVKGISGFRELNYRYVFIAGNVFIENNQFQDRMDYEQDEKQDQQDAETKLEFSEQKIFQRASRHLSDSVLDDIKAIKSDFNLIDNVAESLFPSIYGHPEIKKALVLQLLGGIHKVTQNKINIRGDINILIVGDPATAKSQFLKCVNKFVPRSVYTNGKTTSAAGLTASVMKDDTGNVNIEAGALMLADNGICCIDQFDKMDLQDQTAIHEAMQQQTISIAKAGVHATLNARTSILAAANPVFGRYDKSKSLKNNLNLTAPIMSRFDLFFVIYDQSNDYTDQQLCDFIIRMHRNGNKDQMNEIKQKYDYKTLNNYFSFAKKLHPQLTIEAAEELRECYKQLRSDAHSADRASYRPTVRQLQSLIRLSEAYARLHLQLKITREHVKEVHKLIMKSIIKLEKPIQLNTQQENIEEQPKEFKQIQQQRKNKKAVKKIELTFDHFERIKESIVKLFIRCREDGREEVQDQMTETNLINFIIAGELDDSSCEGQFQSLKKVAKAIIKKMITEQRILMVAINSDNPDQRLIQLHHNYKLSEF